MALRQSLVASGVTLSSSPPAHKSPSAPEETEAQGRPHSPEGSRAAWSPRSTASGAGRASAHVLPENYGRRLALRPARPQPQLLKGLPVGSSRPLDVSGLGPCKLWLSRPHRYGRDRPHLPARHQGAAQPCRCGSWTSDARAAAWPGRAAAALARTALPSAPQAAPAPLAAQPPVSRLPGLTPPCLSHCSAASPPVGASAGDLGRAGHGRGPARAWTQRPRFVLRAWPRLSR